MRRSWWKVALSGALLAWIVAKVDIGETVGLLRSVSAVGVASIMLLFGASLIVSAARWKLFLPGESLWRLVQLSVVGMLYSLILPGQIAGEFVKAYRLGRGRSDAERIAASVVIDKACALLGIAIAGAGAAYLSRSSAEQVWGYPFVLLGLAVLAAMTMGSMSSTRAQVLSLTQWFERRYGIMQNLAARVAQVLRSWADFSTNLRTVGQATALGVAYHLLNACAIAIAAACIGAELSLADIVWAYSAISVVALLPFSVAGLGIREGSFIVVFRLLSLAPEQALALSFVVLLMQLAGALLGLVVELRAPSGRRPS